MKKCLKRCLVIICVLVMGITEVSAAEDQYSISNVPVISQFPELPTGCEVTALTMLLQYNGVNVTKQQAADKIAKAALPQWKGGKCIGTHPSQGFIGSPYTSCSYGVFVEPVVKLANWYLPGRAVNLRGNSLDEVLAYVEKGQPVMIWATISMIPVSYETSWQLSDGSRFCWPDNEHAMVIVGYDGNQVYVNDPYVGKRMAYKKESLERRYNDLGRQAMVIRPKLAACSVYLLGRDGRRIDLEGYKREEQVLVPLKGLAALAENMQYEYAPEEIIIYYKGGCSVIKAYSKTGIVVLRGLGKTDYCIRDYTVYIDLVPIKEKLGLSVKESGKAVWISLSESEED